MQRSHPDQPDFFRADTFESRRAQPLDFELFRLRVKSAMSSAISACQQDRDAICAAMTAMPGIGQVSRSMLDNYTAQAKPHDISLVRFKALVRATGAAELWDMAVRDDGLLVLEGDEARLAEIALLQQEQRVLARKLKALQAQPVIVRRKM
ncbi:MAG: hypothetical protein R3D34_17545 [Nitratireductor sp.]